LNNIPIFL